MFEEQLRNLEKIEEAINREIRFLDEVIEKAKQLNKELNERNYIERQTGSKS